MVCKYCKDENHLIDNCPLIVCRLCNTKGHVDWKCPKHKDKRKNKPKKKRSANSAVINLTEFPKLKINTKSSSINKMSILGNLISLGFLTSGSFRS